MSKKLRANGMWESSRMMLPEHKEQIIQFNKPMKRQRASILDEQMLAQINEQIMKSFNERLEISIVVFDETEDQVITGVIKTIDDQNQRLMIAGKWIDGNRIIDIRQST